LSVRVGILERMFDTVIRTETVNLDLLASDVAALWSVEDDALVVALTEAGLADFDQAPLDLSSLPVEVLAVVLAGPGVGGRGRGVAGSGSGGGVSSGRVVRVVDGGGRRVFVVGV
jgi:hypothetical protein